MQFIRSVISLIDNYLLK